LPTILQYEPTTVIQALLHRNCKPTAAIQNWLKKWRIKANTSKSVHVTFITQIKSCPPQSVIHINDLLLTQDEDVKYLGLHLDKRQFKHIFTKQKQLEITLTKLYWILG
jgi:TnpA family transposase